MDSYCDSANCSKMKKRTSGAASSSKLELLPSWWYFLVMLPKYSSTRFICLLVSFIAIVQFLKSSQKKTRVCPKSEPCKIEILLESSKIPWRCLLGGIVSLVCTLTYINIKWVGTGSLKVLLFSEIRYWVFHHWNMSASESYSLKPIQRIRFFPGSEFQRREQDILFRPKYLVPVPLNP